MSARPALEFRCDVQRPGEVRCGSSSIGYDGRKPPGWARLVLKVGEASPIYVDVCPACRHWIVAVFPGAELEVRDDELTWRKG